MTRRNHSYDIGIIGGGAAGLTIASGASQLGVKTLLIEKEEVLGGDCLHFGCVPSKTLIHSAHVKWLMDHASEYGLPKASTEPVDFIPVRDRIRSVIARIQKHDSVERFSSLGVDVQFGTGAFSDANTFDLNGTKLAAEKWVIASGSAAAKRPIKGRDQVNFVTNREIFSLDRLPEHLVVLGAGPIGIEMAQAFAMLGSKCTVIYRGKHILSKEDQDMSDLLAQQLKDTGIRFILEAKIVRVSQEGQTKNIEFEQNGKAGSVQGDVILEAMGQSPCVDGLGLDTIGIDYSGKGISTNARMRTNLGHIYAAGDITGRYPFTHAAGYEGGIVIANAILHIPRKANYTWLPWCTYTCPELANIGMNEKRAKEAGIDYRVIIEEFTGNDRALAEGEQTGRIKLVLDKKERPLGVQILGPNAGELISEWVAALNGKVKLGTLAGAIHPYPTLGEINKKVVGSLYAPKLFNPKVRKILKLLFRHRG